MSTQRQRRWELTQSLLKAQIPRWAQMPILCPSCARDFRALPALTQSLCAQPFEPLNGVRRARNPTRSGCPLFSLAGRASAWQSAVAAVRSGPSVAAIARRQLRPGGRPGGVASARAPDPEILRRPLEPSRRGPMASVQEADYWAGPRCPPNQHHRRNWTSWLRFSVYHLKEASLRATKYGLLFALCDIAVESPESGECGLFLPARNWDSVPGLRQTALPMGHASQRSLRGSTWNPAVLSAPPRPCP
jgi:hypothetical protein